MIDGRTIESGRLASCGEVLDGALAHRLGEGVDVGPAERPARACVRTRSGACRPTACGVPRRRCSPCWARRASAPCAAFAMKCSSISGLRDCRLHLAARLHRHLGLQARSRPCARGDPPGSRPSVRRRHRRWRRGRGAACCWWWRPGRGSARPAGSSGTPSSIGGSKLTVAAEWIAMSIPAGDVGLAAGEVPVDHVDAVVEERQRAASSPPSRSRRTSKAGLRVR